MSPDDLPTRARAIAEYYISNPTLKYTEIAKQFGVTPGRIGQVLRSRKVIERFPILARRIVQSKLLPMALDAYEKVIAQDQNLQVKEKAAGKVLSESGVFDAPTIRVEGEITLRNVRELEQIVRKAVDLPQEIIEAEVIEPENPPV
jgi:hypothetical protein